MAEQKKRFTIKVRQMDVQVRVSQLKSAIRKYEFRYETKSEEMLGLLSDGKIKESNELVKWMFDYHALRRLEEEVPITGTLGTVIAQSTNSD